MYSENVPIGNFLCLYKIEKERHTMTREEFEAKKAKVADYRPIDDVFFEALAERKEVCEEILRTIMGDDKLTVIEVVTQSSKRNLYGKSVRLDALCMLGNGTLCNIEVQRSDNDNHLKRVRYNAASITTKEINPGEKYENVKDLYIIYISEFDFLKGGKTIYHVDNVIRETGEIIDDGLHRIFVNTAVDDDSDIADLMSCFTKKSFVNPKFPNFSNAVKDLKESQGGVLKMCEIMEGYLTEARAEAKAETEEARVKTMLHLGRTPEEIAEFCGYDLAFVKEVVAKTE